MRKGILGMLAYCLAGWQMAQAQTGPYGAYQEPMPIQYPGMRYGAVPYQVPVYSRFPVYQAPTPANYVPMPPPLPPQGTSWGPPPYSATRAGFNPNASQPTLPPLDEKMAPPPLPKDVAGKDDAGKEATTKNDGPPAEPYLVGAESTWNPRKGYKLYGSAEYLFWHVRAQPVPAGLSLSLSDPTAVPQLASQGLNGARMFLGTWITDRQDWAFEGGFFFLAEKTVNNSRTFPANPDFKSSDVTVSIFDGIDSESTLLSTATRFWGAEGNLRYELFKSNTGSKGCYLDLLGGFRFVDLSENMTINNTTAYTNNPVLLSQAMVTTSDSFGTHNHLFAGQIGAEAGFNLGRFNMSVVTKLGLGDNKETVAINGITQVSAPPVLGNFSTPGGFFAQPSNIAQYGHDAVSVLPEVGVNLGFKVSDHCRLAVGYNFIYFSNVVRPGGQIDVTAGGASRTMPPLSFGLLGTPGAPTPVFNGFNETSFWAQGLNLMVEFNY